MKASERVFINTVSQYIRTVINIVLSLFTVRIVLDVLGASDYGIYTVVAGVVSMLSFVTNALVSTTQRFVSYYQGKDDLSEMKEVFNNCMAIHFGLGVLFVVLLEFLGPFLIDDVLSLPLQRIEVAKKLYHFVVLMVFFSFASSPFRALLISHENIVYISVIDVLDGILKFVFAVLLIHVTYDKLVFYGLSMLIVQCFNLLSFSIYCFIKYKECSFPRVNSIHFSRLKEILSFAGWNVYSTACIVGRQQGVAIVLNRFFGTAVNAAYGVGFQLSGNMSFLSASLVNSIKPQIVKAEGGGDRKKALWLTGIACKFSYFLMAAICVPCMFEISAILNIWLKDVPENAALFCVMVLLTILIDSITGGLGHINQAIGRIREYSIYLNTPKLLAIPLCWFLLRSGRDLSLVAGGFVITELLCTWLRVPFVAKTSGMNIKRFLNDIVAREIIPTVIIVIVCVCCTAWIHSKLRILITFVASISAFGVAVFLVGLNNEERRIVMNILKKKNRIK